MKIFILVLTSFLTFNAWSIPCDCEVRVHSPLTGSYKRAPVIIKTFELESFSHFNQKNIQQCQDSCVKEFQKEMPTERLNALLVTYSMQLIDQKVLGFNCTGLTTLKYPIRVKAKLADRSLGNVADMVQVVNHEEVCF